MRELAYSQKNNNIYKYQLINSTQGINLMPFVFKKSLSYSKFERTVDNKFSSNTMSFTLKFQYEVKEIYFKGEKLMYISSDLLKGYTLTSFESSISEAPAIEGYILLDDVIKAGHEIHLIDEYQTIFVGVVESAPFKRDNTGIYIDVSIKDKTNTLYELTYLKSYLFKDMYLSNNADKSNSLLHQLGYLLGFEDDELDIDDVKDSTDTFIQIPFVHLKKGELIISDLAEAVRVTNSVYNIVNNKLTIRLSQNRITETYQFDKRNILKELNKDTLISDYEKVKVTYDRYFKKDLQDMWILTGENGTADNANIKILAGDTRRFNVTWFYNVSIVDSYEVYDVLICDVNENPIEFEYDLELDETGGVLEFKNTGAIDLYVKSFKIKAIPLFMQSDNESYYPSNITSEKILSISNKFVQNYSIAKLYTHINYLDKCRSYRTFKFTSNVANFLETGVRTYFEHEDYTGYVIIEKIVFKGERFEVEVREELEQLSISDLEYSEKTFVDEAEILSKKYLEENGLYEKDKPLAPKNLVLTAQFLGFDIEFEESLSSLRGHYVYLRRKSEIDFSRYFINTNKYFFETTERVTFEVKVSSVSINGVEGETTEIKEVTPLKLNNTEVEYPEGLSPQEIDDKVGINEGDISILDTLSSQLVTQTSNNETTINQNSSDIQSIAQRTTQAEGAIETHSTAISQNAQSITSVAQEVETKTNANDVETITNTAIELFSANEFKRTLGTSISKIDYSKSISDPTLDGLTIGSEELKEVKIVDIYSSIYQTSQEILLTVKKDNIVSAINLTPENLRISGKLIEVGSGLVVEGDKVAVRNLTAESLQGKRLEGAEIISENEEKTERIYINSGKVVHEKRASINDTYKSFEKLVMQESGEIRCQNDWSEVVDFKLYNNNLPWSNLKVIAFVGNQYDLSNGVATSREIIKEWVGDVSEQRMRFKVAGGNIGSSTQDASNYTFTNSSITIENVVSLNIDIAMTRNVEYVKLLYGIKHYYYGKTEVFVRIDNGTEIKIGTFDKSGPTIDYLTNPSIINYSNSFNEPKTISIRKAITSYNYTGSTFYTDGSVNLNGSVVTSTFSAGTAFDCTVNWLAIGNS